MWRLKWQKSLQLDPLHFLSLNPGNFSTRIHHPAFVLILDDSLFLHVVVLRHDFVHVELFQFLGVLSELNLSEELYRLVDFLKSLLFQELVSFEFQKCFINSQLALVFQVKACLDQILDLVLN